MMTAYIKHGPYKLYVFPDDEAGRDEALKLCAAFGFKFFPGATDIKGQINREIYSGNLLMTEKLNGDAVCTVSKKIYERLALKGERLASGCEKRNLEYDDLMLKYEELQVPDLSPAPISTASKEKRQSITESKLVFIAGRGIGSKANYERLKDLGRKYGAAVGCTRPVAMNGWESYDNVVGISGNILNAETVVCFGVSGSGPFIKGIENCKTIISINNNKSASIFNYANYGIADDCLGVISYLENNNI